MDFATQVGSVLVWLGLLKALQLSLWPYLKPTLGRYAYPAAYPVSLLLYTLIAWYGTLFSMPMHLSLLPFLGLGLAAVLKGRYALGELRGQLVWDAVFFVGFLFMLEVRFVNPVINYFSEQYMNHAFIAGIMRDPRIPPLDPWFAGGHLTVYYYLGHFMMGSLGILGGVPSEVVFNLVLPTVFGLSLVMLFATGDLLLDRWRWLPMLTLLLVPPSVVWFLAEEHDIYAAFQQTNWIIPGARVEFPLFSFLLGNAHAFEIGLFNQTLLVFLLAYLGLRWESTPGRGRLHLVLLAALSLGSMPLLNAWDVLLYGPFVGLFVLYHVLREWRARSWALPVTWIPALLIPVIAILAYLPYYGHLDPSGVGGIGFGFGTTDLGTFAAIWGIFLLVPYLAVAREVHRVPYALFGVFPLFLAGYDAIGVAAVPLVYLILRRKWSFPEVLCIAGLSVLVFCEVFYMKELYSGDHARFNTIFKFYYDAWVLLAIGSLLLVGRRLADFRPLIARARPQVLGAAAIAAVVALLAVPLAADIDIGRGLLHIEYPSGYYTLDGLAYLETAHPGDAAAVRFLKAIEGDHVIVEAEYGDYRYASRVSAFTGIPTILGQPFHELTWRHDESGWSGERKGDIRSIYEDPAATVRLMAKYNATLLYVGEVERGCYDIRLPPEGLVLLYDEKGVQIHTRVV